MQEQNAEVLSLVDSKNRQIMWLRLEDHPTRILTLNDIEGFEDCMKGEVVRVKASEPEPSPEGWTAEVERIKK